MYYEQRKKGLCLGNSCIAFPACYVGGIGMPILSAGKVPGFLIEVFKLFE